MKGNPMKLPYALTAYLTVSVGLISTAWAQPEESDVSEPPVDAPPEPAPTEATPAAVPVAPAVEQPAGEEPAEEAVTAPAEPAAPGPEAASEESSGPAIDFALFADTYVSYNSAKSGTPVPYHRAYDNNTPFDPVTGFPTDGDGAPAPLSSRNGFGLSFVGLDATFSTGIIGVTALLRFGPSVPIYYGTDASAAGLNSFLAGYVTVAPTESFSLDAGYFGTIYGAEVAESWRNLNYSRGGLYYAMQPFYHFGVKGKYIFNDYVNLTAMVVNGANNVADENDSPALGLQLGLTNIGDVFNLAVGGFYETGADSAWGIESFFDVVATVTLGDFSLIANFDYNINRGADGVEDTSYYGVMGAAAYNFIPEVGVAVRGEYLMDVDSNIWTTGIEDVSVATVTGTLDLKLVEQLIVRPEFRVETSSEEIYVGRSGAATDAWWTAMIGLVATSAQ
jgi:hypothetical protein